jgi:hypothetical protein
MPDVPPPLRRASSSEASGTTIHKQVIAAAIKVIGHHDMKVNDKFTFAQLCNGQPLQLARFYDMIADIITKDAKVWSIIPPHDYVVLHLSFVPLPAPILLLVWWVQIGTPLVRLAHTIKLELTQGL